MRPIFARRLLHQERAAIVLCPPRDVTAPQRFELVGVHASSVRYWIHRFKEDMATLRPCQAPRWGSRLGPDVRAKLIRIATTPPREMGLEFKAWTLRELRKHLVEQEIVKEISHETIRRILKDENIDWQVSGILPENSLVSDLLETFPWRSEQNS